MIFLDNMLVKKWKPNYATIEEAQAEKISPDRELEDATLDDGDVAEQKKKKKKKDKSQRLSTKGIISRFKSTSYCG